MTSLRLSENYTLDDLSTKVVFPHTVASQHGLSEDQIIINLTQLAVHILEPLKKQFPGIKINSAFRIGDSTSQHERGEAADIQIPGAPGSKYSEMAEWISKNLEFDQFILEHGKSVWLHISRKATGPQRRQKLTYYPKATPAYTLGLKNHYDNGKIIR